jgi:hypothetical protein
MEGPNDKPDDKRRSEKITGEKIVQTRAQKLKGKSGNQILKNTQMFKKDEYESNLARIMEEQ